MKEKMWIHGKTLGVKEKDFLWAFDGDKIIIIREMKGNIKVTNEFTKSEIDTIISFIRQKVKVPLANSVSKMHDGTEKDGLGMYIFQNISTDTTKAQAASQLAAIFYQCNIVRYNGRKVNMEFWINDSN